MFAWLSKLLKRPLVCSECKRDLNVEEHDESCLHGLLQEALRQAGVNHQL